MDRLTVTGYRRCPPHVVAEHKGFFAKEGLEIEFHTVTLAPQHNREMAEGRWPITLSSADTMIARSTLDHVDYVLFMQPEQGLSVSLIGQRGISSMGALRGQLIAGDPGDRFDLIRNKILRSHGLTPDDYSIEIVGSSPKRLQAFLDGKVAAAMLSPPSSDKALAAGGVLLADAADYFPDWPLVCGWGLRRWVEANRPLVVRFVRAWANAADWLLQPANRDETLALLITQGGVTRKRAEQAYHDVMPHVAINPEGIRKNMELRIELGVYPPPHHTAEYFYDASYWCEATGRPAPPAAGLPRNAAR